VLLTTGQIDAALARHFARLHARSGQTQVLRTAVQPAHELPAGMVWIKAIGPFDRAGERQLLARYAIDVLVSKNSGGEATRAKLDAARELGVPVLMLERPSLQLQSLQQQTAEQLFGDPEQCRMAVQQWFEQQSRA
jgi:precorrin-6A/cobalt-precorrin-6A reductase